MNNTSIRPRLYVQLEGVHLELREVETIAEAQAKLMNGSVLQIRGGHTNWEFRIELDPNRYK